MGKIKKINVGDIFAIKIEGTDLYYFGKVLFDVKKQYIKSKEIPDNYFGWYGKCILIELYNSVSSKLEQSNFQIAVKSTFIPPKTLLDNDIIVLRNESINPQNVTFPENFRGIDGNIVFSCGELGLVTPYDRAFADEVDMFPALGNMYWIKMAVFDYSGRRDLIEDEDKENIKDDYFDDIRNVPSLRKKIYTDLGEDMNQTYYEFALKHGFDLARFY